MISPIASNIGLFSINPHFLEEEERGRRGSAGEGDVEGGEDGGGGRKGEGEIEKKKNEKEGEEEGRRR